MTFTNQQCMDSITDSGHLKMPFKHPTHCNSFAISHALRTHHPIPACAITTYDRMPGARWFDVIIPDIFIQCSKCDSPVLLTDSATVTVEDTRCECGSARYMPVHDGLLCYDCTLDAKYLREKSDRRSKYRIQQMFPEVSIWYADVRESVLGSRVIERWRNAVIIGKRVRAVRQVNVLTWDRLPLPGPVALPILTDTIPVLPDIVLELIASLSISVRSRHAMSVSECECIDV